MMGPFRHSLRYVGLIAALVTWGASASAQQDSGEGPAPTEPPEAEPPPSGEPPAEDQPSGAPQQPAEDQPSGAPAPPGQAPPADQSAPAPGQPPGQAPAEAQPAPGQPAPVSPEAVAQPEPKPPLATQPPAIPTEPAPAPPSAQAQTQAPGWPAQAATPEDTGVAESEGEAPEQKKKKSRWRVSRLLLDQSVTADTVGIGQDYQSRNPTYDWTLQLLPRYYFIDEDDWTYSVLGNVSLAQELTNSDETTKRRQLDVGDSVLSLRYDRIFHKSEDGYRTSMSLVLPDVVAPTSRASRNNGRILGLAASVVPLQIFPLASGEFFSSLAVAGIARYQHYFTRAEVPTNNQLDRIRTDVGGRSIVSDQLSGSAFAKHETRFGFSTELAIHERVSLASDFQWRPTWNYKFKNDSGDCINILTGCAQVDTVEAPQHYQVVTVFDTEVAVQVLDELSVTLGYVNLANQIGPDGRRRSMFYSPNARFYLTVTAFLSEIFDKQNGPTTTINPLTASNKNPFVW